MGQRSSKTKHHEKLENENESVDDGQSQGQGCFCCSKRRKGKPDSKADSKAKVILISKDFEGASLLFEEDGTENAMEHSEDDISSSNNAAVDGEAEGGSHSSVKSNNSKQGTENGTVADDSHMESAESGGGIAGDGRKQSEDAEEGTLLNLSRSQEKQHKIEQQEEEQQEEEDSNDSDEVDKQVLATNKILLEISQLNADYKPLSSLAVPLNQWLSIADGVIVNCSHPKLSAEEITNEQLTSCQAVKENVSEHQQHWAEVSPLVEMICSGEDKHISEDKKSSLQVWAEPITQQLSLIRSATSQLVEQLPDSAETAEMFESTYNSVQKWLQWAEKESLHLDETGSTRVLSPKLIEKYTNLHEDILAHQPYILSVLQLAQSCTKAVEAAAQIGSHYQSNLVSLGVKTQTFKGNPLSPLLLSAVGLSGEMNTRYTNLKEKIAQLVVEGAAE